MEVLLVVVGIVIYFIPSFIGNDRRNFAGIFVLNLLLGWTFIGWVGSLIWALLDDKKVIYPAPKYSHHSQTSAVDQIVKLTLLREKGAITEAEYQNEKQKILNR